MEFTYKDKIREALYTDFKKPFTETDLTEIYPVIGEIKFAKSHLKSWVKRQKVETPVALPVGKSTTDFKVIYCAARMRDTVA